MRLHLGSVHLLTCTCLRLQTDLLPTHERRWGQEGGLEVGGGCSPLLSTQHTEEAGDACCSLPPAATVAEWKASICSPSKHNNGGRAAPYYPPDGTLPRRHLRSPDFCIQQPQLSRARSIPTRGDDAATSRPRSWVPAVKSKQTRARAAGAGRPVF